jgi:hypothetical protein
MKIYVACQLKNIKGKLQTTTTFGYYSTYELAHARIEEMCAQTMEWLNCSLEDIMEECGYTILEYEMNQDIGDPCLI